MKKKYFIVLDTETANSVGQPLPYDIGWVITDKQGNIYEKRSYVVAGIWTIRRQLLKDMKAYETKEVWAYNMGFDKRALNNDIRYITKSWARWFFPYGTEFKCIWNVACQLLLARKSYIKFAEENNFVSPKGNILTNAECCYRYITKEIEFKESHTGLEDTLIETAILAYCFKQHKKFDSKIYTACWMTVQKKRKEMRAPNN